MPQFQVYNPSDFGKNEVELRNVFWLQMNDARNYFQNAILPRLDRSYKLYVWYTGDRRREIQSWQSNIFVPYVHAVVETLMPRILDARPDFTVQWRSDDDQLKAEKQQQLMDFLWETAKMDKTAETLVRSSLIYGTWFLQVSWKKDVREQKFLKTKDLLNKKYVWEKKQVTFYDAPYAEWVDNYSLWYDWHNTERESKQYWIKRLVLTEPEIRRRYPMADKQRLELAFQNPGADLSDYARVRQLVKSNHQFIIQGIETATSYRGVGEDKYNIYGDQRLRMYEVFEWWRPYEDAYCVMVGGSYVPIFKNAVLPIPYDFKEAPFIDVPYIKLPNEFEWYGLPMILESPQLMLNMIKNQRLDNATLSIHKMWIVNPLANINKDQLVTRPFGIIYSIDPNGVREIQFGDIKESAYKEEDLLKSDMRYSSGVDDFSMGQGGGANSATEVRHLREATLERVRLYVNHLGDCFSDLMRYWMDMSRQFFTKEQTIRIVWNNWLVEFPLIEKDDLMGKFDYKASVLPSIAGMNDVKKKQDMDLYQLLVNLPFIDPRKLTSKILTDWNWSIDTITNSDQNGQQQWQPQLGPDGQPLPWQAPQGQPQGPTGDMGQAMPSDQSWLQALTPPQYSPRAIPPNVLSDALQILNGAPSGIPGWQSQFAEASAPINLTNGSVPPTVAPLWGWAAWGPNKILQGNPRGLNMGWRVNTNLNLNNNSNIESSLMNRTFNIQR